MHKIKKFCLKFNKDQNHNIMIRFKTFLIKKLRLTNSKLIKKLQMGN